MMDKLIGATLFGLVTSPITVTSVLIQTNPTKGPTLPKFRPNASKLEEPVSIRTLLSEVGSEG